MRIYKFVALAATAIVAAVVFGFETENANAEFVDLMRVDCAGTAHMFKNTPFEMHFDVGFLKAALDTFRARVKARVDLRCPNMPAAELNRRFIPSLDLTFNFIFGDVDRATATVCGENYADDALDLGSFYALLDLIRDCVEYWGTYTYGDAYGPYATLINAAGMMPASCSLATWTTSRTCKIKVVLSDFWAGIELQAAATTCGEDSVWPFAALQCGGDACKHVFQPCTADSHCGIDGKLTCQNIGSLLSAVDVADVVATGLTSLGVWHSSMPSSNVWDKIVLPARKFWGSYFTPTGTGSINGASSSDYFKFCLPQPSYLGNTGETIIDIVDTVMYSRTLKPCTIRYECVGKLGTPSCAYPYYQTSCDINGNYTEKNFNFTNLFKTSDGAIFTIQSTSQSLFSFNNTNDLVFNRSLTGNPNFFGYKCHVASSGTCNLGLLGNGFCDPSCNIAACKHDGGDCVGPAEVLPPTAGCSINNKVLSASSACKDTNSTCFSLMFSWENTPYQAELKSYYCNTGKYNSCCLCNNVTTTYMDPPKNFMTSVNYYPIAMNVIHSWDGILTSGADILGLASITTLWPPFSYTPGETQLFSFDCNGFAQFTGIVPLFRVYVPGPLAIFKQFETVLLEIVALRQSSQSGISALVTSTTPRKLTKLGIMTYGFWTPGYPLWQFTPAIRREVRDTSFQTLSSSTPGTKMMRDSNPSSYHLVAVDLPDSCSFTTWVNTGRCLLEYTPPILTKIEYPITFNLGLQQCPNSHIPEVTVSAKGVFFDQFPLLMPCLQNSSCPMGSECVDLFNYVKDKPFSPSGKSLQDLEFDILTFLLYGKAGRAPNWSAAQSWATQDIVAMLKSLFGSKISPNPYNTAPNYAFGEMKLCFDLKDPFMRTLVKYGKVYDWGSANQGVEWTTQTTVSSSVYTQPMDQIQVDGLASTSTTPDGFGSTNTAPPTGAPAGPPTKKGTNVGNNALGGSFNGYNLMISAACLLLGLVVLL